MTLFQTLCLPVNSLYLLAAENKSCAICDRSTSTPERVWRLMLGGGRGNGMLLQTQDPRAHSPFVFASILFQTVMRFTSRFSKQSKANSLFHLRSFVSVRPEKIRLPHGWNSRENEIFSDARNTEIIYQDPMGGVWKLFTQGNICIVTHIMFKTFLIVNDSTYK